MRVTRVRLLVLNFRIPVYTALSSFSSRARLSSQHAGRSVNEKSSARTIQIIIISPLLFLYKRIYRAAKSSRDKIERDLSLAANSTLTIITERGREGEREKEKGPLLSAERITSTATSPRWLVRGGPAGQLSSFAPTPHRSRLIGLFPVNRKSRLEMSIRGP